MVEKIFFVKKQDIEFINNDEAILKQKYDVDTYSIDKLTGVKFVIKLLQIWVIFVLSAIRHKKMLLYIWFADYHSLPFVLAAKILQRKSIVVIGGYDAVKMPEINYGGHIKPFRSWCIKQTCHFATNLLPVSYFTQECLFKQIGDFQGQKSLVLYNGADELSFYKEKSIKKDLSIITVCSGSDLNRAKVKGIDRFVSLANEMPNHAFKIVGLSGEALEWAKKYAKNNNIHFLPKLPKKELQKVLCKSNVICQFSRYESFGIAVVEGMLCECVPIGMANTGLGEIIDRNIGFLLAGFDLDLAKNYIEKALANSEQGLLARQRALDMFSIEKRRLLLQNYTADFFA